jgi:hypothetical protein
MHLSSPPYVPHVLPISVFTAFLEPQEIHLDRGGAGRFGDWFSLSLPRAAKWVLKAVTKMKRKKDFLPSTNFILFYIQRI